MDRMLEAGRWLRLVVLALLGALVLYLVVNGGR
jgi:YbbR domain-containing protein